MKNQMNVLLGATVLLLAGCGSSSGGKDDPPPVDPPSELPEICSTTPSAFFEENVFSILTDKCSTCHVDGGVAGNTRWQVQQTASATQLMIDNIIDESGFQYALDKPSGATSHGGGSVLPSNSTDFDTYSQYVMVIGVSDFCDE